MAELILMPTHPRFKNLIWQKFSRLFVVEYAGKHNQRSFWKCRCDCGKTTTVPADHLTAGRIRSCGCLRAETAAKLWLRHGHKRIGKTTRVYKSWCGMRERCRNPNNESYKNYGGRGIKVCRRWNKFENFLADMGEPPEDHTIERIDNNKNYCSSNCRWATKAEQCVNRRSVILLTHCGQTHCMAEWARILKIKPQLIQARIRRGWSAAQTLSLEKWPKGRPRVSASDVVRL